MPQVTTPPPDKNDPILRLLINILHLESEIALERLKLARELAEGGLPDGFSQKSVTSTWSSSWGV